jgi:ParE toxin of type II toxin-antitoxin system, parDE
VEINQEFSIEIKSNFVESIEGILDFIRTQSYQNALLFEKEIVEKIYQIGENPEAFPILQKIKTKRLCRFVPFKKSYQIYYHIDHNLSKILILDICHVKREPKSLKYLDKL